MISNSGIVADRVSGWIRSDGGITFNGATYSCTSEVKNKNVETLYNVIVVDKKRNILLDKKAIAQNIEAAKFNADVYEHLKANLIRIEDVTIICNILGSVEVNKD